MKTSASVENFTFLIQVDNMNFISKHYFSNSILHKIQNEVLNTLDANIYVIIQKVDQNGKVLRLKLLIIHKHVQITPRKYIFYANNVEYTEVIQNKMKNLDIRKN